MREHIEHTGNPLLRIVEPTIRFGSISTLHLDDGEKAALPRRRPVGFNFAAPAEEYPLWCDGCVDLRERCLDHR